MMLRKGMFLAERYEVIERIGAGGMSDVYKAKDHKLNRFVAIKVLKSEYSDDKVFVSKFRAEAQSAAGLAHPNIVNVYDVGDENGIHYIVMELVEGITLKKYIEKKGRIPYKEAVSIAIQVANGIEAAHSHHIVHRDIKPQNIIISKEGKVKVTDFGIAKAATSTTITSSAMGSVHYISPEQARGGYSDERSDIYSFGITLFEMLTGTVPFDGDTTVAVAVQHIQDQIPAPSSYVQGIPVAIDKIVLRCTQKKVDMRYQNATEMIQDLKKALVMPDVDFVKMPPMYGAVHTEDEPEEEKGDILAEQEEKPADIDDESNEKLDAIMKWIGIGIAAVIVIALIFVVVKMAAGGAFSGSSSTTATTQQTTTASETATVPDVVGKSETDARSAITSAGLTVKVTTQESSTVQSGYVISQSMSSGTKVNKGTTITIVVAESSTTAATTSGKSSVPNVVGMSESAATSTLQSAGFTVSNEYSYSGSVSPGNVISQTPSSGSSASSGALITIVISRGAEQTQATTAPTEAPTPAPTPAPAPASTTAAPTTAATTAAPKS